MASLQPDYSGLVRELRANFETRKSYSVEYRLTQMANLRRGICEMEKEILNAVAKDLRKHVIEGFLGEIGTTITEVDFALNNMKKWAETESFTAPIQFQPGTLKNVKQPKGVVLIIAPWNFPIQLSLVPLVAAIASGCAAVIKPSEMTPESSKVVNKLVTTYLDQDLYRVVEGDIPETTGLLAQRWNHVFYTGNGSVGKIVARAAAESLCSSTLELGGKSPVFIAPDANVRVAARRIVGNKTFNNGQICVAPDYVLCHKSVVDEFIKEMKTHAEHCYTSEPQKSQSLTRVVNARHWDRLAGLLNEDHGGKVLYGGLDKADKSDLYMPFTIVLNPKEDCRLMTDEIFGPILPVIAVESLEEALRVINSKESSLASYIFTENTELADKFVKHTNSGGSSVNECVFHITFPDVPFGGHSGGGSGYGAYHGIQGFREFTHERILYTHSTWLDPNGRYAPHDANKIGAMRFLFVDGLPQYVKTGVQAMAVASVAYVLRSKF